jgi:hypothetical protein
MVMSVTTQKTFPYMSDARTPAMDVQMTAQDVGMLRSFSVSLSAMLIVDDGYDRRPSRGRSLRLRRKILFSSKRIWLPRYRVGNRPPPKEANLSHVSLLLFLAILGLCIFSVVRVEEIHTKVAKTSGIH